MPYCFHLPVETRGDIYSSSGAVVPTETIIILYYYNDALSPSHSSSSPPPPCRSAGVVAVCGRDSTTPPGRIFRNRCTRDWLGVKRSASVQCVPRAGTVSRARRPGDPGWRARGDTTTGVENQWAPPDLPATGLLAHSIHSPGPAAAARGPSVNSRAHASPVFSRITRCALLPNINNTGTPRHVVI